MHTLIGCMTGKGTAAGHGVCMYSGLGDMVGHFARSCVL